MVSHIAGSLSAALLLCAPAGGLELGSPPRCALPAACAQDPHKFRGKAKTKSAKASRVGPKPWSKENKKAEQ